MIGVPALTSLTRDALAALVQEYQRRQTNLLACRILGHLHYWRIGARNTFAAVWLGRFPHLAEDVDVAVARGVLRAADDFDAGRGTHFCSYAAWWVRAYVLQVIHAELSLVTEEGGATEGVVNFGGRKAPQPGRAVYLGSPLSADDPDGATFADAVMDAAPGPEDEYLEVEQRACAQSEVQQLFKGLRAQERFVMTRRYLSEDEPTLDDVGEEMGVSRERIRQLETRALERLSRRSGSNIEPQEILHLLNEGRRRPGRSRARKVA